MAGAAQKGQHPGGKRGEKRDVLRMFAQEAFGKLHHDIEPTGSLQGGCTTNHGENGQHHVNRRLAGLETKDKTQNKKANPAD